MSLFKSVHNSRFDCTVRVTYNCSRCTELRYNNIEEKRYKQLSSFDCHKEYTNWNLLHARKDDTCNQKGITELVPNTKCLYQIDCMQLQSNLSILDTFGPKKNCPDYRGVLIFTGTFIHLQLDMLDCPYYRGVLV